MNNILLRLLITSLPIFLLYGIEFDGDFKCLCGCGKSEEFMDQKFLDELKELQKQCSFNFHITSGYRCETGNKQVGGSHKSRHTHGMGVDLRIFEPDNIKEINRYASESNYFSAVYDEGDHIHIDRREDGKPYEFKILRENHHNERDMHWDNRDSNLLQSLIADFDDKIRKDNLAYQDLRQGMSSLELKEHKKLIKLYSLKRRGKITEEQFRNKRYNLN